jgi:hypothetical protein
MNVKPTNINEIDYCNFIAEVKRLLDDMIDVDAYSLQSVVEVICIEKSFSLNSCDISKMIEMMALLDKDIMKFKNKIN